MLGQVGLNTNLLSRATAIHNTSVKKIRKMIESDEIPPLDEAYYAFYEELKTLEWESSSTAFTINNPSNYVNFFCKSFKSGYSKLTDAEHLKRIIEKPNPHDPFSIELRLDLVFDKGSIFLNYLEWGMRDSNNQKFAEGIQYTDSDN